MKTKRFEAVPAYVHRYVAAMRDALGYRATVWATRIHPLRLYRVTVLSHRFEGMPLLQRERVREAGAAVADA